MHTGGALPSGDAAELAEAPDIPTIAPHRR